LRYVTEAAMTMPRRDVLDLVQRRLLEELDSVVGKDVAPIAKTLAEVSRELESLPTGEVSSVDDLARKRAARRAEAAG
jgi:hypothetical protein